MENRINSKYNEFLEAYGGVLGFLSIMAIIIACAIPIYKVIAGLFKENAFVAGWIIPISYSSLYTLAAVVFIIFSVNAIGCFLDIEKKEETEVEESKFRSAVKYYVIPALFCLICLGGLSLLIDNWNVNWIFGVILLIITILSLFPFLLGKRQDRFMVGSHIFPILTVLATIVIFDGSSPKWLNTVLIILSIFWFIMALLRSENLLKLLREELGWQKETEDIEDEKENIEQSKLLKSVTAQKLLTLKIAELQAEAEKKVSEEFEQIRKEYVVQLPNDNLEIEPAIKELVENSKDYLSVMEKINKRIYTS